MTTSRRLAAIVATDVVGYSRLMGADEEGTRAAMRRLRDELWEPKVERFGGRIVKTTGDGQLLEFPSLDRRLPAEAPLQGNDRPEPSRGGVAQGRFAQGSHIGVRRS